VTEPESTTDDLIRAGRREATDAAEEQKADHMAQHEAVREVSAHTVETSDSLARLGQAASAGQSQTSDILARLGQVASAEQSQTTDALIRRQGDYQASAMEGVIAAVDRLRDAILFTAATKDDVLAAEAGAEAGRRGLRRLTIVGISVLLLLAATNVTLNARNGAVAGDAAHASRDAARNAALLVDCNTPSTPKVPRPCYDRNQAARAEAVAVGVARGQVNTAAAVTAGFQCARQIPTLVDLALRDCVMAKLKKVAP